jgi:thiol:disulfide interchange protein
VKREKGAPASSVAPSDVAMVVVSGLWASLACCESPSSGDHSSTRAAASALSNERPEKPWPPLELRDDLEQALKTAAHEKRPVVLGFFADWDMHSKELERSTLVDPQLVATHGRFVGVRVDATDDEVPRVRTALRRFEVKGIPTILILDSTGKEVRRIHHFVNATELSAVLASVP